MKHSNEHVIHPKSTLHAYLKGFIISLILTLGAYFTVVEHLLAPSAILTTISTLAFIQALVQLYYFLHLGQESKPHWNMLVFLFMAMILAIVVIGSLWIMYHLNYNMVPTIDVEKFLQQQRGL